MSRQVERLNIKPLRVLLSEGGSTSARQAITLLGMAGHTVDVCDPARLGLGRWSRFVRRYLRCPGLRDDPRGFAEFIAGRLAAPGYDVLLPIHEQGLLFARIQSRLAGRVGFALPFYASYHRVQDKAGFSRLLAELGLPQPAMAIVRDAAQLRQALRYPAVIKTALGTASRGVWMVRGEAGLAEALKALAAGDGFAGEVLVQEFVEGATEKAQGVFCRGELLGFHAYRQVVAGAGGGDAVKRSVRRDGVRGDLAAIGRHLCWHGALSVDYIMPDDGRGPFYIDGNPRLVEPMAAWHAGVDLVALLLRISLGETPEQAPDTREGVVTHQAMQVLLGCALRGGSRRDLLRQCGHLWLRRGAYRDSAEELTPVRIDRLSAVPLAITALLLLGKPGLAKTLAARGWGAHLLDRRSAAVIDAMD